MSNNRGPDELVIWNDENQIIFHLTEPKYVKSYEDEDEDYEFWVTETDGNQIEVSYRYDEKEGWGIGGSEYVSTRDVKEMADCIRSVINKEQPAAKYVCQDDLLRIEISYSAADDTYSFAASMLETLMRDHHITVTKDRLSREQLEEYIRPFFIWEKKYPILEGDGILRVRRDESTKKKAFCSEPILRTHRMQTGTGDEEMWERLDYSGRLELVYHAFPNYWLVFETERYYITVGADGIKKYDSLEELKAGDRQVWNDYVTGIEEIVFPGESIRSFWELGDEFGNGWEIVFDHIHMTIIPHKEGDGFEGTEYQVDKPFLGFRHVLNKCVCGGRPDFMMDRHGDFYVECPVCKRYSIPCYDPMPPVRQWNSGETYCVPGNENIKANFTKVFIQLDGVLADVSRGITELCHLDPALQKEDPENYLVGNEIKKVEHFFEKLEPVPGVKEMFDLIYKRYGERCEILAGLPMPRRRIVFRPDMIDWIHRNLAEDINIHFAGAITNKMFCHGKDYVLIDNREEMIADWERCGGKGILFTNAQGTIKALKEKGLL